VQVSYPDTYRVTSFAFPTVVRIHEDGGKKRPGFFNFILFKRDHKLAAFTYCINRMITLSITEKAKKHEWKNILNIAQKNGFPTNIIHDIKK